MKPLPTSVYPSTRAVFVKLNVPEIFSPSDRRMQRLAYAKLGAHKYGVYADNIGDKSILGNLPLAAIPTMYGSRMYFILNQTLPDNEQYRALLAYYNECHDRYQALYDRFQESLNNRPDKPIILPTCSKYWTEAPRYHLSREFNCAGRKLTFRRPKDLAKLGRVAQSELIIPIAIVSNVSDKTTPWIYGDLHLTNPDSIYPVAFVKECDDYTGVFSDIKKDVDTCIRQSKCILEKLQGQLMSMKKVLEFYCDHGAMPAMPPIHLK